ncbi:MAG: glycosyltransferase family protein [Desulfatibacillaceae bacterium]
MSRRNKSAHNILMYSHDTYGLGHIRRTMSIANHLRGPNCNVLIMTGSPLVGRFTFPEHVDFVRIPGMIKRTNEEYQPLSIRIHPQHAINIRRNIITATAKAFAPDLFVVDKEPLGLKKEVYHTLKWMRKSLPRTRTVLGLRDIMDDREVILKDWRDKGVYEVLDDLYSEIWVYGEQQLYDPVREYDIPESVSEKVVYTGYIPRTVPDPADVARMRRDLGVGPDDRLVVVTTGGGGDGQRLMHIFLSMLEAGPVPFKSALVTGPFMPRTERDRTRERADSLGAHFYEFFQHMERMLAAADLVVSMGGYNTVCELLSQGTLSLLVPRETPRREQLIRAGVMADKRLADYIRWDSLEPARLREKILAMLDNPAPYRAAMGSFSLTGLDIIKERIARMWE